MSCPVRTCVDGKVVCHILYGPCVDSEVVCHPVRTCVYDRANTPMVVAVLGLIPLVFFIVALATAVRLPRPSPPPCPKASRARCSRQDWAVGTAAGSDISIGVFKTTVKIGASTIGLGICQSPRQSPRLVSVTSPRVSHLASCQSPRLVSVTSSLSPCRKLPSDAHCVHDRAWIIPTPCLH